MARGARALAGEHAADQAAVLLFDIAEAREGGQQALLLRFGVVNAGHQRLGDLVQGLAAQTAADKFGQGFIMAVFAAAG